MSGVLTAESIDPDGIGGKVGHILVDFLDGQASTSANRELAIFTGLLKELVEAGGKRIRPVLCVTGWQAVSEQEPPLVVLRVAASLEMFHLFALIHDDVMDRSALRRGRGRPTVHRQFVRRHRDHPDAARLGVNAAILLGDLALGWSFELLNLAFASGGAWSALNSMRVETMLGQYLDLVTAGNPGRGPQAAWDIVHLKTSSYTVERPLQVGAVLAGANARQLQSLRSYAVPLGEAFQLRDDLLGIFGDPDRTGKPASDDLREGKHTVLISTALRHDEMPVEDAVMTMRTEYDPLVRAVGLLLPGMRKRGYGHIVAMGSSAGRIIIGGMQSAAYAATKAAVEAYTQALRLDLVGSPVAVTLVRPGVVAGTSFFAEHVPSARLPRIADIIPYATPPRVAAAAVSPATP